MNEYVNILVTCRKPELLPAALLVFRTLRTGFPDRPVRVWCQHWTAKREYVAIRNAATDRGAEWMGGNVHVHDKWTEQLIEHYQEPFWICDTDVVFWKRFEHTSNDASLAGVHTPAFFEPWTGTQYRERLHTCLMRIDPVKFKKDRLAYHNSFPKIPFCPLIELVRQQWQPERGSNGVKTYFYDTLAMAWHAFGGQDFTPEQIESFDHLNCATYADLIGPSQDFDMEAAHAAIYEDHTRARGLWAKQFEWFAQHQTERQLVCNNNG